MYANEDGQRDVKSKGKFVNYTYEEVVLALLVTFT